MWTCKYCLENFNFEKISQKANHSRWCLKNPKLSTYREQSADIARSLSKLNKGRKHKESSKQKMSISHIGLHLGDKNPFYGKNHTNETKNKISEAGLKSNHRRLLRSTREYIKKDNSVVLLDSSWEEELARRLDILNIEWQRPTDSIQWIDKCNKVRNYFPDFYLPQFKIYLDPKNSAAYKNQEEKINWLIKNRQDIIFLKTLKECKEFTGVRLMEKTTLF